MAEKLSKEQVAYQKELNALYKTGAISLKQFNTFLAEGNTLKKGQLQNATNHFKKEQQITKEKQKQKKLDEELIKQNEELVQLQRDYVDLTANLNKSQIFGNKGPISTI